MNNESFMKEKPVIGLVLSMSLPMVFSMMVNALYNIVDSFFVAKISEDAMTALSLVFPVQNLMSAVSIGFGVGINAVIAFFLGAGEKKKADQAASLGFFWNAVQGLVLTVVCIAIIPVFLRLFSNDERTIGYALEYSKIVFLFGVIISCSLSFEKIFQAVGNMVITMIALMTGCIVNIVLDPLLIFGIGFFPKLGIQGAALATGIGQSSTLILYLIVYILRPIHVKIRKDYLKLEAVCVKRLYAIGIPATLNMALPSFLVSALNAILASFSQTYVVVLGVYYKLQTFLYLTANGMIQGMRPIMSYNYGAKESARVRKIYLMTFEIVVGIMAVGTVICFMVPQTLMSMFTNNPETLTEGAIALRIICAGFIASSVSVVSAGAFEALGKGIQSFLISFLRYVVLIIPAAFVLSKTVGVHGVWHAFWIAEIITAVIAFILYYQLIGKSGKEKLTKF